VAGGCFQSLGIGTIFSSTDTVCTLQVLRQEETPLLYSLVFGEGVVNDAPSVVLFNVVQKINADTINGLTALHIFLNFLYLFTTSTLLGFKASSISCPIISMLIGWAGVMRGDVSIALAFKQFTHSGVTMDPSMITTTIVIVLFSTIVSIY
ncbi:Na+/H+ antiporter, partial [Tanacetum coccineum]